jgi:uncharacterized delta-60 repeat protein
MALHALAAQQFRGTDHMMRAPQFTGLAMALLMTTALAAPAQAGTAGTLDPSFGSGTDDGTPAGVVGTWLGKGDDVANDIISQPDGKVVVVGNHTGASGTDIFIARYNADGTLDESFGTGAGGVPKGIATISLGDSDDFATTVALQPDGHIVVGGYHMAGTGTDMVALRVKPDGTPDESFGKAKNGILTIELGDGNEDVRSIAVTPEGKIVLAGNMAAKDGSSNMVVLRLNADGTPDKSFAPGSGATAPGGFNGVALGTGQDVVDDMALTPDGKIVLAGTHGPKGNASVTVIRLQADGALDQTFGTQDDGTPNGVVSLSLDAGDDVARGIAIDPKGRIVVVADSVGKDGTTDVVVARLKPDGNADEEFAVAEDGLSKGAARTSMGSGNDNATDVVLDSQGHIIVAGYHQQGGKTRVSVLRFTDDGKLDESFGAAQQDTPKGTVGIAIGEGNALANGITMQGDKLILVGGGTTDKNGNSNIALMRLLAN